MRRNISLNTKRVKGFHDFLSRKANFRKQCSLLKGIVYLFQNELVGFNADSYTRKYHLCSIWSYKTLLCSNMHMLLSDTCSWLKMVPFPFSLSQQAYHKCRHHVEAASYCHGPDAGWGWVRGPGFNAWISPLELNMWDSQLTELVYLREGTENL